MKTGLCVLTAIAVLAIGTPATAQIFANPPAPSAPAPSWREQRALDDWRNNTWRERRFDQDWRNNDWRQRRANEDWRAREEYERQRMPNSATDYGAFSRPVEESKDNTAKEECAALPAGTAGPCPNVPVKPVEQPAGEPESPGGGSANETRTGP